jgi:hypothetical protein
MFATTQAIISPYFISTSLTYKARTFYFIPKRIVISKNPIVMGAIK